VNHILRVEEPGLSTTVQDLGRPNAISSGVPPGGAMDRFAHAAANLLVGNGTGAATLECTLSGPHVLAEQSCLVAVTGADFDPHVNGKPMSTWTGVFLGRGDRLTFAGRRSGARAYIAVAGGIDGAGWLGSLSTNLMAVRGGLHGRSLRAGDVIDIAGEPTKPTISGRRMPEHLRPDYADHTLHVIAGPHFRRLDPDGRRLLFNAEFTVTKDSDRMGYRLDGPKLETSGDELLSFGLAAGAIQAPSGGQLIMLMADHQTAGGYPVVAAVVSAALPIAAQLLPGDTLRFAEVTPERARQMRIALTTALDSLRSAPAR
jgi:antagonist of KipI